MAAGVCLCPDSSLEGVSHCGPLPQPATQAGSPPDILRPWVCRLFFLSPASPSHSPGTVLGKGLLLPVFPLPLRTHTGAM